MYPFARTSFSVNSCLFMHSEISRRFSGKNDNVVLQFRAEENVYLMIFDDN